MPFGRYVWNTSVITLLDVVRKMISCSLVAFSFARLRWRGREIVFLIMLATMMLPPQVTMIPYFIVFKNLELIDTIVPLVLPNWLGGPFLTFLLRQFFMSIPLDLDDAARIDGTSIFGIYWRIVLPLSKPALAAVAIFMFNGSWNDFFGPLIYLHSRDKYTISLGLRSFQDQNYTEWHLLMAASLVAMLPVVLIFFFAQKYFIQGIVFTGVGVTQLKDEPESSPPENRSGASPRDNQSGPRIYSQFMCRRPGCAGGPRPWHWSGKPGALRARVVRGLNLVSLVFMIRTHPTHTWFWHTPERRGPDPGSGLPPRPEAVLRRGTGAGTRRPSPDRTHGLRPPRLSAPGVSPATYRPELVRNQGCHCAHCSQPIFRKSVL